MGIFEQFPYTNFHDLNLDWILHAIQSMDKKLDEFVASNVLSYADPIQWDIETQYAKNTVVVDPKTGTAYMSINPVPVGQLLTNKYYWQPIFNYDEIVNTLKKQIAAVQADQNNIIPVAANQNELVWVANKLYRLTKSLDAGSKIIENENAVPVTVEEIINDIVALITQEISDRSALIKTDENGNTLITTSKKITESAPDITLDVTNGLTYKMPARFSDCFNSVPMKDTNGNTYNVLTSTDNTKYVLTGYTAESLGVIADDSSEKVREDNRNIINAALSEGKTILFGKKTYHINCGISMAYKSGLVGAGSGSILLMYGDENAITVNIKYEPTTIHDVWTSFVLTNLKIVSATPNVTKGRGLYIQNYTYNVTCGGNYNQYVQTKGDGYGLELRNSNISYLYIAGFHTNIFLDDMCALITMDHIITTDGITGIEDYSHDSNMSNIYVTFAKQTGLYMRGNLDARYTNVKIYQNGKNANSTKAYSGIDLNDLWGGQFSNVTSEENAGRGINMTGCKGVTLNVVVSSNGFAPLSTADIYNYTGLQLTDCEGIVGTVQAIDKHALYSGQAATQGYGFVSSKATSANLIYYETGNKKSIKDFEWTWIQCLHPVNNTLDFVCQPGAEVELTDMKSRYHDNKLEIFGYVTAKTNVPAGNWLLILNGITYDTLTANIKSYDKTFAIALSTTGTSYPLTIIPNQYVQSNVEIPAGTVLYIAISVPVTILVLLNPVASPSLAKSGKVISFSEI